MSRPYSIKIPAGQPATPPCAGEWQLVGDEMFPADAATARGANLGFPRPVPASAPAAAPVAAPATTTTTTASK